MRSRDQLQQQKTILQESCRLLSEMGISIRPEVLKVLVRTKGTDLRPAPKREEEPR